MPDEFQKFMIRDYKHWGVYVYKNQFFLGRVYLWARREDAVDLMQMAFEEREELFNIGRTINRALTELFNPDLINYAALGNISTHLHLHVIPRYASPRQFDGIDFVDKRWGKNYAPYDYNFEVPESTLLKLRDAIKERL